MPISQPSVVLNDLTFAWPDGSIAIDGVTGAFGRGRTGLVGLNGVGKSTLLRLIAGILPPTSGSIGTVGTVDYLPQTISTDRDATVADVLGVRPVLDALRVLEAGDSRPEIFETIGDDWDVEERSIAALASAGLELGNLDRRTASLSGGEAVLTGLVGVMLRGAPIALLDEPTNNLDEQSRERVNALVRGWRGALIVVSHDIPLLELMDDTAELRAGSLELFGGPYSVYREQLRLQQEAAERALRAAEHTLKVEKRQRVEAQQRIAHSEQQGRRDAINRKYIGAVVDDRRNSAEKSQGARRAQVDDKVAIAQAARDAADLRVRDDDRIVIRLPDPDVPAGRRIAALVGSDGREFVIQGPERVALTGPNGVGKTTLLRTLLDDGPAEPGPVEQGRADAVALTPRIGYLSQRLERLDERLSVLDNVRAVAPGMPTGELRNQLARLLIRGDMVARPVWSLSGGERFRVALAQLLLADPPAQLLVLDEPTNNLDLSSVGQLVDALAAYRGALLVVSHDRDFLGRLGVTTELSLGRDGVLSERREG